MLIYILLLVCDIAIDAQSATIQLLVSPVETKSGSIMVALYDNAADFLGDDFVRVFKEPVTKTGEVVFQIEIPKHGTYALSIFHDVNANGKLEKNFMGIPTEPYGFSNDAPVIFGPPKFEDAKFEVKGGEVLKISLR